MKGLTSVQNSISFFKMFSLDKNQSIEPRGQTLNQSRSWLRVEIYFFFFFLNYTGNRDYSFHIAAF